MCMYKTNDFKLLNNNILFLLLLLKILYNIGYILVIIYISTLEYSLLVGKLIDFLLYSACQCTNNVLAKYVCTIESSNT